MIYNMDFLISAMIILLLILWYFIIREIFM